MTRVFQVSYDFKIFCVFCFEHLLNKTQGKVFEVFWVKRRNKIAPKSTKFITNIKIGVAKRLTPRFCGNPPSPFFSHFHINNPNFKMSGLQFVFEIVNKLVSHWKPCRGFVGLRGNPKQRICWVLTFRFSTSFIELQS